MKIDTYTIASIACRLKTYLDFKQARNIKKVEVIDYLTADKIMKIRNDYEWHQKRKQFTSPIFTTLYDLYNSKVINIDTIMAIFIDYYIRTGKPMNYNTKMSFEELKSRLRFLSVLDVNAQLEKLEAIHNEYKQQSAFNKFSGQKLTLFGVNEQQENKLYELVKSGEISFILFAFFMEKSKFTIDESKIKDLYFLKFVRLIKYAIQKQIKIEKIKYEV